MQFNVHQAKSQLSKMLAAVDAGEQVEITRSGKSYRIVPVSEEPPRRPFDLLKDKVRLAENWNAPDINAEIARELENGA